MKKLSCTILCRDDGATLQACLESIRPHVDELIIVDTGSNDNSPEIAQKFADRWELYLGCNDDEGRIMDFGMARNYALDLASGDAFCWFDADDVVEGGQHLRALADQAGNELTSWLALYEYQYDAKGRCTLIQQRERVMSPRHAFEWLEPVHEVCMPKPSEVQGRTHYARETRAVVVKHRSHLSTKPRDPERNLRILREHARKTGESDPRVLHYLGIELSLKGVQHMGESLTYLKRHVELDQWSDQRCLSLLAITAHYQQLNDHTAAVEWGLRAIATKAWRQCYFQVAKSFYALALSGRETDYNYRRAAAFIEIGLTLAPSQTALGLDPSADAAIHEWLNVCLARIGNVDGAIASCERGLREGHDSDDLRTNLAIYEKHKRNNRILEDVAAAKAAGDLADGADVIIRETLKGTFKVELLNPAGEMPSAREKVAEPSPGREPIPGRLHVVFYVGQGLEPWNPRTVANTGIGGSELMVMHVSRGLAAMGHAVTIYGHCTPELEGEIDGVLWLDSARFKNVTCDVLVSSRRPDVVDENYGCNARARVLWVHDVNCGEALTHPRDLRFDTIVCLSDWHRVYFSNCYPKLNPAKVTVVRNCIDPGRFTPRPEEGRPRQAFYSSSPDRGLGAALTVWPRVRKEYPDAELHIYYGFFNWESVAKMLNSRVELGHIAKIKHLVKATPGVVMHGRVTQEMLARAMWQSQVWFYPTWFSETSCITAMEARAARCRIVTSRLAALPETLEGYPVHWLDATKWLDTEQPQAPPVTYLEQAYQGIIEAFKAWDELGPAAGDMPPTIADAVAQWDEMLRALVETVDDLVVPPFFPGRDVELNEARIE